MQIPLLFGWRLSVVLTKGKYSCCLNPHVGIYRWNFIRLKRTPWSIIKYKKEIFWIGIKLPPSWRIFNIEWRKGGKTFHPPQTRNIEVKKLFEFLGLSAFYQRPELRVYYKPPFGLRTMGFKLKTRRERSPPLPTRRGQ